MNTSLPVRLIALLTLPLAAAFAQESTHDDAAAPQRVRRVMLAPAAPAEPLRPAEPRAQSAAPRGQIGVFLGADGEGAGAGVRGLVQGGGAAAAGLQPGDRILALDDHRIATSAELIELVKSKQVGDSVSLMIDRDGWRKRITVELRPAAQEASDAPRWQVVEELEEDEEIEELHFDAEHGELDELRKLIELRTEGPGEVRVERRLWINGEEVSPEEREGPRRIRWRIETDDDLRSDARREAQEQRQRELRMERAQRQRERLRVDGERRVEREVWSDPRADLEELRRELRLLRREVEALRRELDQQRR